MVSLTFLSAAQLEKPVGVAMVTAKGTVEERHFLLFVLANKETASHGDTKTQFILAGDLKPQRNVAK